MLQIRSQPERAFGVNIPDYAISANSNSVTIFDNELLEAIQDFYNDGYGLKLRRRRRLKEDEKPVIVEAYKADLEFDPTTGLLIGQNDNETLNYFQLELNKEELEDLRKVRYMEESGIVFLTPDYNVERVLRQRRATSTRGRYQSLEDFAERAIERRIDVMELSEPPEMKVIAINRNIRLWENVIESRLQAYRTRSE